MEKRMSIKIHLHKTHRQYTDGLGKADVEGKTVGECLQQLVGRYPDLENALFDGRDKLKKTIEIYLNMESTYPEELAKPTKAGDEIHIILMLAGG